MFLCLIASLVSHFTDAYGASTVQEPDSPDNSHVTDQASGDAPMRDGEIYHMDYTHQTHTEVMPIRCAKRTKLALVSKSEADQRVKDSFKNKYMSNRLPYLRRKV